MATIMTQSYPTNQNAGSPLLWYIIWIVSYRNFICLSMFNVYAWNHLTMITGSIGICGKYCYWNSRNLVSSYINTVTLKTFVVLPVRMTNKCKALAFKWTFYLYKSMWITRFPKHWLPLTIPNQCQSCMFCFLCLLLKVWPFPYNCSITIFALLAVVYNGVAILVKPLVHSSL